MAPSTPEALRRLGESLAHHLNNALTGVMGFLELALHEAPADDESARQLQAALLCAARAAEIVRRLVRFACRPEQCEPAKAVDLRALADAAADPGGRPAPAWAFRVEGEAVVVRAGGHALRAALDQLVANAVEAMPDGGEVLLRVGVAGGRGLLAVRDHGPGLTPEAAARLFEPFVSTKASPHLGVGLALARDLLLPDGGQVEVRSDPGGTTATLSLPLADAPQPPAPPSPASSPL